MTAVESRLYKKYREEVVPELMKAGFSNPMEVPRIEKVVVNMGVGRAIENRRHLEYAAEVMTAVTGQKPRICKARVSAASFKLRAGQEIGCMVTLRRQRMYEFLDRLLSIALPRIRDFRGLSKKSFDRGGNYSLGLSEQWVFPEVSLDNVDSTQGMDITLVTSANSAGGAEKLLDLLGFPFQKPGS